MDLVSIKSNSISDVSHTSSVSAKLRRLKIEESLLLQGINKPLPEFSLTGYEDNATSHLFTSFKDFSAQTKNSYREIKTIFQDIKTSTSSRELLELLDIDEVKKSTFELENRIKAFKLSLQSELTDLKTNEQKLNQTLNEKPVFSDFKRQPRIQTAKYNEIVPSPVKILMTSPFKCPEVQQLQEFMMNSVNRYGGWNEYHHNMFVHHWQKHFGSQNNYTFDEVDSPVKENSPEFNLFIKEILPKLRDFSEEDIILHVKWYSRYIYLKERQQKAIDKWRTNRKIIRSAKVETDVKTEGKTINRSRRSFSDMGIVKDKLSNMKDMNSQSSSQDYVRNFARKCFTDDILQPNNNTSEKVNGNLSFAENKKLKNFEVNMDSKVQPELHFQKSTKQWNLRVNSKEIKTIENLSNLENMEKLCIPTWRANL